MSRIIRAERFKAPAKCHSDCTEIIIKELSGDDDIAAAVAVDEKIGQPGFKADNFAAIMRLERQEKVRQSVVSVNGLTGAVEITAAQIGAVPYPGATQTVNLGGNDLIECAFGPDVAGTGVLDASLAGNGKATGNRQADAAHLGKVCALAAKHEVHGLVALGDTGALGVGSKTVNPLAIAHDTSPSMRLRARPW